MKIKQRIRDMDVGETAYGRINSNYPEWSCLVLNDDGEVFINLDAKFYSYSSKHAGAGCMVISVKFTRLSNGFEVTMYGRERLPYTSDEVTLRTEKPKRVMQEAWPRSQSLLSRIFG